MVCTSMTQVITFETQGNPFPFEEIDSFFITESLTRKGLFIGASR